MEKTLIILKPDCIKKNLYGSVFKRFQDIGLSLVKIKDMILTEEILLKHYEHLANETFFPKLLEFMTSSYVIIAILEGENAIEKTRALVGQTDSKKAQKGTIRGDFGENQRENICHCSDSKESVLKEISIFFGQV